MRTITVVGGNLFQIAAKEFDNPLHWIIIARINHLIDPFLTGQTQLMISPISSAFSDGTGPQ
jgi:hypothetical protein